MFIAYSMIDQQIAGYAASAREALDIASRDAGTPNFIEVLDCGENLAKLQGGGYRPGEPVLLYEARALHPTVFRGDGLAGAGWLEPVELPS